MSELNPTSIDRLSQWTGENLSWLFLIAVVLSCYEVIMDWLFRSPTIWVHDSTIMLCSTCFLFGGAYAMQRREHIRITVIYDWFSSNVKHWCDVFTFILTLLYLLALSAFTGKQALDSIMRIERSGRAWDFPMPMIIRTALFLGAALLVLQAASQLYQLLRYPHHTNEPREPLA
jgi:TRAP-type mannitol/chloroaromatic compound transport system permease small subunit